MKVIPQWYLKKTFFRKTVILHKYSVATEENPWGERTRTLKGSYPIKADIQEIVAEDLKFNPPGILEIGDAYGYFLPSYMTLGGIVTIEVEDEIEWNKRRWRVERIEDFKVGEKEVYKRAYLKRVV